MDAWQRRVEGYCDLLEVHLDRLRNQLAKVRETVASGGAEELIGQSNTLAALVEELNPLLDLRQELLDDAPMFSNKDGLSESLEPMSLVKLLARYTDESSQQLLDRCELLANELRLVHQETNALFLAEYTLVQTTGELLSLLTTGSTVCDPFADRRNTMSSGQIFDRAA